MSGQFAGSTRGSRLPADWRRTVVPRILDRDGHTCQIRLPGCAGTATEVDHVIRGDDHSDDNLRAACPPCHRSKSGKEGAAVRHRYRMRRDPEPHPGILP